MRNINKLTDKNAPRKASDGPQRLFISVSQSRNPKEAHAKVCKGKSFAISNVAVFTGQINSFDSQYFIIVSLNF